MTVTKLGLLFGGRSGEHEVSVMSARSVFEAACTGAFDVVGIGITREGAWVYVEDLEKFFGKRSTEVTAEIGPPCFILPDATKKGLWIGEVSPRADFAVLDAVFPVLHGLFGEDGTIQGLLEMSGIPYVGADPLASAICMDKDTTKRVLATFGVPHVPAMVLRRRDWEKKRDDILSHLKGVVSYPVFVKPSGSGSSLGVTKVKSWGQLASAIDNAFLYDTKALIEPAKEGFMEVECSVLGNDEPRASVAGQILPAREFYDYEAKYEDEMTRLVIPAPLDPPLMEKVKSLAMSAFRAIGCSGMARVDFFVNPETQEVYVNELNTIPGFTDVSMYPKLWEASGLPYPNLIKKLVELAIERKKASWKKVHR